MKTLSEMAKLGKITRKTLVWTKGMAEWEQAINVKKLNQIFSFVPPELKK